MLSESIDQACQTQQPVGLEVLYCTKPECGQMSRSCWYNSGAIRLKRSKNLTQIDCSS